MFLPDWTLVLAKLKAVEERGIRVYTTSGFELMLDGLESMHCHACFIANIYKLNANH